MENQSAGWIAAFWASIGIICASILRWVAIRLLVPRDAMQKKYFDDLREDIGKLEVAVGLLLRGQEKHGAEIAFIKGLLDKRS